MGRQDVEDHFVGNGFFDLAADMLTVGSESLVGFSADHLDDAALDDMGRVTLDQPVYHAGTADQSDLADGQRQQWVLDAAVQLTAGHELLKAITPAQLLLQFLLVEPFALEYLDLGFVGRQRIAWAVQLGQHRYPVRISGILLQAFSVLRRSLTAFSYAHDHHLLEFFELSVRKTPDGDILKIIAEDTANIRRQTVVRDHIQQQTAVQQMGNALDEKPLFVPCLAAALVENGEVRRVQEQQVERFSADVAMKKAAKAYTVQAGLRLLRTAFIQFHPIGIAVVALGDLPQRLSAAAAGVYVLTDFDTKEKALSGAKATEKGLK